MINEKDFDERGYLDANPDVAKAVHAGEFASGFAHYSLIGHSEGRKFAPRRNGWLTRLKTMVRNAGNDAGMQRLPALGLQPAPSREEKILAPIDKNLRGLEIGPSHRPIAPKSKGYDVKILDHLDTEGLREKYRTHGVDLSAIEEVDFVWSGEPLSELVGGEKFDWIIASHVIEHTPDLIGFLNECEKILTDTGVLSLAVPDKRFCFDHFREITPISRVMDAHLSKTTVHTAGTAADYFLNVTKKGGLIAWHPAHSGPYEFVHGLPDALAAMKAAEAGQYIDLHAWCFTPSSFRLLVEDLFALGLTRLREKQFFDSTTHEFFISLQQGAPGPGCSRMDLLHRKESETHAAA